MTQAAALLARGQKAHAAQYPAGTVTINGQAYTGFSTSGVKRERDLVSGGWLPERKVTFWAPRQAFTDAGKSIPIAHQDRVMWNGEAFAIDVVSPDAAGVTLTITCIGPDK